MKRLRRSVENAPGFLKGKLLIDGNRAFWTMSMWKDIESMRAFRDSKVHTAVMPKTARWCDEASVVHWETEADELPDWQEAYRRMSEAGKPSPLKFRSADYKARRYKKPFMGDHSSLVLLPRK
jgi:uncharacterized protein DUF3291